MRTWTIIYNTNTPGSPSDTKQSVWDRPGIMADQAVVMSAFTDKFNRARLLAASAPHSGNWLQALTLLTCGLTLDNESVRVAVGLRLCTGLFVPHQCPYGKKVDARGTKTSRVSGAPANPYDTINSATSYVVNLPRIEP